MGSILVRSNAEIGNGYPKDTNRLIRVVSDKVGAATKKIALMGDSTIDNGFWVQQKRAYKDRTGSVRYQTAKALAEKGDTNFDVACFAIDGAEVKDVSLSYALASVIPIDPDHPYNAVTQTDAVSRWKPDVIVLSVGGNNYRVPIQGSLMRSMNYRQLLTGQTPQAAKNHIHKIFSNVKKQLLIDYKKLIDDVIQDNPQLERLVLVNQYYPELTKLTGYFIYSGFGHVANSERLNKSAFDMMKSTMNEVYREITSYALNKDKKIVLVDAGSSISPLDHNHVFQIEPNSRGANIMGNLIAKGIEYSWPNNTKHDILPVIRSDKRDADIYDKTNIQNFSVKPITEFIKQHRFKHVQHFFLPETSLAKRFECALDMMIGKSFDPQYRGLHAFGLIDLSLVTYVANYLWSIMLDQNSHMALRVSAGIVGAPLMLAKAILGLSLLLVLGLPIYGFHHVVKLFEKNEPTFPNALDAGKSALPVKATATAGDNAILEEAEFSTLAV